MHRFAVAVQWKLTKRRGKKSDSGHWEKSVGKAPTMATQPPPKISQTESGIKSDPHTHTPSQWKSHPFPAAFHNFPRDAFVQRGCNRVRFMFVREISLAQQRHHWKIKDFQFRTVRVFINYSSAAQLLSHTFYCKFWKKRKKNKGSQVAGTTTHVYERNPSSHPLIKNTCLFAVLYLQLGIVYGFSGCVNWLYMRFAGACN